MLFCIKGLLSLFSGGRFREVEERNDGAWHERRGERGYRESEKNEGRERSQDDGKTSSRTKRSRTSPEPSRGGRKGQFLILNGKELV